jgi:hypothetical protein
VIKRIALATARYSFYKTEKNEVKCIDTFDLLDSKKIIIPTLFAYSLTYEHVSLDSDSQTIALWTKNPRLSHAERSTITIHHMINPKTMRWDSEEEASPKKYYALHASFNENTYNYRSSDGIREEHNSHFAAVNLCKSTVIAFASTGQLFVWKLPALSSVHPNPDQNEEIQPYNHVFTVSDTTDCSSETITTTTTTISTPDSPALHSSTEKKKISPRTITLFTSATSRQRSLSASSFRRSPRSSSSPRSSENQSLHNSDGKERK